MKILVTGGAGFIGSHVVDLYIDAGHDVVVVDNLSSGRRDFVHPQVRFYELDIREEALRGVFEREHPDVVNHHAAQAAVPASVANPALDADINVMGTLKLLRLCQDFGVRKFIFASTGGAIYGEPAHIPADESHPTQPLSPYGIGKLAAEQYVGFFGAHGMQWAILRYANVYGPRQDPEGEAGVVAIFLNAMLAGRQPTIFGDGTQTRDFVYVEDVAWANLLATTARTSDLANIASGTETSVNDLFRLLARSVGFDKSAAHAPARAGDVYRIALNPVHADRWLGWTPSTSLAEGITQTIAWFRNRAVAPRG